MAKDPQQPPKIGRRKFVQSASLLPAGLAMSGCTTNMSGSQSRPAMSTATMMGHAAPAMDTVRVGVIGAGRRGTTILRLLSGLDGIELKAICDPYEPAIAGAKKLLTENSIALPSFYASGDYGYKEMLERDDIDAVFILTPWQWHTPMAVDVMLANKHTLVEVPAALTLDECWQLVETSEQTRMHCMMMENVCYGRDELMTLNMVRQGVLGELLHGEAAYIHELRWQMKDIDEGTGSWRTDWHAKRNANLYPTHGLGPIAQFMNINRGDRFDYLSSMSTPAAGRQLYAEREFPADHARNKVDYICGDMNTSLIKTAKGRTIMVQHDTTTPRPYTRHNLVSGTNGVFARYPNRIALDSNPLGTDGEFHEWQHDMTRWYEHYEHPLWQTLAEDAAASVGHGGMDFVMLWHIVYSLRNGLTMDQNVYDAASWSAVIALSEASIQNRGDAQDFPDFTRNVWKTAPAIEVMEYGTEA